jgi:plastocyanin
MPRLHTSSRALAILAVLCTSALSATVSGAVEIQRPASPRTHAAPDIVVWLDSPTPEAVSGPPAHVRLLQKDKTFRPHLLVIKTGTIVEFPNYDPIFHNAFSTYDGQIFDVGLYPPGTTRSVRFRRPGVVRVFCNIHPSMSAVIVVVDTDYFTTASPTGEYRIANVAPGAYRLNAYDERATGPAEEPSLIRVENGDEKISAPLIRISEAGYVQHPHKNKYGRDYPPQSDNSSYDGVMK